MLGMFRKDGDMMLFGLSPSERSFRGIWLFLAIYVGSTIFAAVLTPPVYWMVEFGIETFPDNRFAAWLSKYETDVYFDRLRWIGIIIGIPWVMSKCGLFSLKRLGIGASRERISTFLRCFGGGAAIAIFIFSLQVAFTKVSYDGPESSFAHILVGALLSGLIIGFLEELIFRGLIMRCFYTAMGAIPAVILSSAFFAYKHFKVPNSIWDNIPGGRFSAEWNTGFYIAYYDTIGISVDFNLMVFLSLFMFGAVLCVLYLKTKTLMAPMGLHAGIVASIVSYRKIFTISDDPNREIFGNAGMTNGYVALAILTIIFAVLVFKKWGTKESAER